MFKSILEITGVKENYAFYSGKYYDFSKKNNSNEAYKLENFYSVTEFIQDKYGKMIVMPKYLMPNLRSVPSFPKRELQPGNTWQAKGEEIFDTGFSKIRYDMNVNYQFVQVITNNGEILAKLLIDYQISKNLKNDPQVKFVSGKTHTIYYWNIDQGAPNSYTDEYSYELIMKNGDKVRVKGNSQAQVIQIEDLTTADKQKLAEEITEQIEKDEGANVQEALDGIIVNLENILFDFGKYDLKPEAFPILNKLVQVLNKYPNLEIAVSGHTDNIGNKEFNQTLSEQRAKTVADYLVSQGIDADRISYVGYGDTKPIASNLSETGRSLNRRVEIKIITNE